MDLPFFVSIPHSGEQVPTEATWLKGLPEPLLMCDVDRYVDRLYGPALKRANVPVVVAKWHRYAADLNRLPEDVDADSVEGSANPSGRFTTGLHWVKTTTGEVLMPKPISQTLHQTLLEKYFWPFHREVEKTYTHFKAQGHRQVYQLDAHSMPSMGTTAHRDPGKERPEIVISDVDGTSCASSYKDLVIAAYEEAGFQVAYNWPYKGGRVTQTYGQPAKGQHAIQVEMRRSLYMDEKTKKYLNPRAEQVQDRLIKALQLVKDGVAELCGSVG